ncbi:prolyl oligopeptidase family protein [Sphingomonas sp. MMS24-J13]|uniref:prolyl oligopeptidase family serine peptidase n=1 Tax=Sphingomonas sp. MMS24-J13 TaxID=3238686 RepID=UPI0038509CB1
MRWMSAAILSLAAASAAFAQNTADDPYLWLEQVSSPQAMAWVESHNASTVKRLEADPRYQPFYDEALKIAGASDRIPAPQFINGMIYNFWRDPDHLRGILRKTTLADYQTATPHWTTVLDIDALNKAEGKSWVYSGLNCLMPEQRFCLVSLSNGGEDAVEIREFDLETGTFVPNGFHLPRAKQDVSWDDQDHLLISTEWTPGDLTPSGYAYIVKRLTRGQPLSAAVEIYRGDKAKDLSVNSWVLRDGKGNKLAILLRALDFFHTETYVLTPRGPAKLAIPAKSNVSEMVDGRVIVSLNEAWTSAGPEFVAGSLAELDLAAVKAAPDKLKPRLVWAPGPRDTLDGVTSTRDKLILTTLDNVRGRAWAYTPKAGGGWTSKRIDLPDNLSVGVTSTDERSNLVFWGTSGFLTPSTLYLADTDAGTIKPVKSLPARFDASQDVVEQREVASSDGVKIPYFVVHRKDIVYDGTTPTILTAYGGFQVSQTPYYSGTQGKLWLEQGGALALANIRGGGEFGPAWHEAGLGVKRQIVYDDFAAVAKDLIARKITSPRHLGIEGGSNGGLLMGVQFVQHPDLWNAVVIEIPLLDMIRIGKIAAGASWQGEYGDVNADPAVMAFWQKTSPYQNLKPGVAYPEPFIFTTTKDDRVGPQHARKFAARLEEMKLPFYYYENTEGGHGAGADMKQAAKTTALTVTYLHEKLFGPAK